MYLFNVYCEIVADIATEEILTRSEKNFLSNALHTKYELTEAEHGPPKRLILFLAWEQLVQNQCRKKRMRLSSSDSSSNNSRFSCTKELHVSRVLNERKLWKVTVADFKKIEI